MMIMTIENRDLFTVSDDYYLAHCVSADFGMGKGIALEFNKRFDMKSKLIAGYGDFTKLWDTLWDARGTCLLENRVFNLVTKRNYWHKPTYDTLKRALEGMKEIAAYNYIKKIAMPVIGCGLDRLSFDKVSEIITEVFVDTDIEILVCKQEK